MKTQSTDTNLEVEKFFISLIRKVSAQEKLSQTLSFSSSIMNLSKRAISRANPELSDEEKNLLFVKYHYGDELAERVRLFINKNKVFDEV